MQPAAGGSVSTQSHGEGTRGGWDSQMLTDGPVQGEPEDPIGRADIGNKPGAWSVIQKYLYIIECLLYASHLISLDPSLLFCKVRDTHQWSLRPLAPSGIPNPSDCPALPLKYGAMGFQDKCTWSTM